MCTFEVDEVCPVYLKRWRTARKAHTCDSCRAAVVPGAQYQAHEWLPGHGERFRKGLCCFGCAFDLKAFGDAPGHRGWPTPDWFADALRDCIDGADKEDAKEWRDVLAGMARRRRWMRGAK